ncbi:MAG: MFS transporter, partial [Solobacterium sp.]|nr:MFS transporter [Solobacterium sp.]
LFVVFELILFLVMKEQAQDKDQMKTTSVGEMFRALFRNDQAVITVITIILINSALYITSNLIIYFFKYDLGPTVESWQASYTTFSTVGGGSQILSMMAVYPALRRFMGNTDIFKLCLKMSITGYALLLAVCFTPFSHNIIVLCAIGLLIFMANGMLTVLTTVFLSNSVDYGELKTGHREESVIFSMQTFVVKAASGVAVFLTGIGLDLIGLKGNSDTTGEIVVQSASTLNGLHLLMTIIPILGLIAAMVVFTKKFILTDEKAEEIAARLRGKEIPL